MSMPLRPNLAGFSSRLAANNGRVINFLKRAEAQLSQTASDQAEDDWAEVLRLGQYVAQASQAAGYSDVARQANLLCQHLDRPESRDEALAALVRLIGMCGRLESALEEDAPHKASADREQRRAGG